MGPLCDIITLNSTLNRYVDKPNLSDDNAALANERSRISAKPPLALGAPFRGVGRFTFHASLPNTKLTEYRIQQILSYRFPGDFAQGVHGGADVNRDHYGDTTFPARSG